METGNTHPNYEGWQRFQSESLSPEQRQEILNHVIHCEFCAEIWQIILNHQPTSDEEMMPNSPYADEVAGRLYRRAFRGLAIPLKPFDQPARHIYLMAADGVSAALPEVENLGEAFCQDPDVVLRLMRNNRVGQTYLQLVSDNPALYAGVLVQSPELGLSLVTDHTGRAVLANAKDSGFSEMSWVLKLPDVEFTLEPLTLGPEPSDETWSTTLDAGQGGRLRLTLERKGSSKFIRLEILELDGQADPGPMLAAVSLDSQLTTHRVDPENPILVPIDTLPATMNIRLYR